MSLIFPKLIVAIMGLRYGGGKRDVKLSPRNYRFSRIFVGYVKNCRIDFVIYIPIEKQHGTLTSDRLG